MSVYSWTETVWDCIRSRKTSIMARTADITKIHGRSPSQPEDVNMSQHCFTLAFSASRGEQDMLKTNYWHHQCVKSLYVGSQSPLYWNMVCFWLDESFFWSASMRDNFPLQDDQRYSTLLADVHAHSVTVTFRSEVYLGVVCPLLLLSSSSSSLHFSLLVE